MSGSMSSFDFNKLLQYVLAVVNSICGGTSDPLDCPNLGPDGLHLGVITFGGIVEVNLEFNQYLSDIAATYTLISTIVQGGGATALGTALRKARRNALTNSGFRGVNSDAAMMVVITDGCASDLPRFDTEINNFNTQPELSFIDRYAIGVGNYICTDELNALASSPANVLRVDNFDGLQNSHSRLLSDQLCTPVAEQGDPGDKGRDGRPGDDGADGFKGLQGVTGPQGQSGTDGFLYIYIYNI